jgi:hypothetical protein
MTPCPYFINSVKDICTYLKQFHKWDRSFFFEKRITEAVAVILEVPLYTADDTPPPDIMHVQWFGKVNPNTRALSVRPDAIANCKTYFCAIDITLSTGTVQWRQECVPVITHFKEYLKVRGLSLDNTFLIFVPQTLNEETYDFIHKTAEIKIIPIELPIFVKIFETASFPYTLLHVDFKTLLLKIAKCVEGCNALSSFRCCIEEIIIPWQKDVLKAELHAFIGIKIRQIIGNEHHTIGMSDLMLLLNKDREVVDFFALSGIKFTQKIVSDVIITSGFARRVGLLMTGEELFEFVPQHDFIRRYETVMKKMAGVL